MQTFWKNRDALFNWKYKCAGMDRLAEHTHIPVYHSYHCTAGRFFYDCWTVNGQCGKNTFLLFLFYAGGTAAISILAFSYEKERYTKLFWLIPQRFIYRWLMYYVLFKTFRRAIKGELQNWGVLKRTGNVKELEQVAKA